jgi:hypothetical protein
LAEIFFKRQGILASKNRPKKFTKIYQEVTNSIRQKAEKVENVTFTLLSEKKMW